MTTSLRPFSSVSKSVAVRGVTDWPSAAAASPREALGEAIPKVWLRDITLRYKTNGAELLALDNINLKVKPGEFLCIVGPSGCGKSTLLHLIAGLQQPTSGTVLIDNDPIDGPGTDRILIFQELGLFPWLTVAENVEFGMKMKAIPKAERRQKTQDYLRLVQLSQFSGQLYSPAFRRNASARGIGPRACHRAGCSADGRTVRRAGRPDARLAAR